MSLFTVTHRPQFVRTLGDSELSYYLPSRADGVNDMYLHLSFRAPASLFDPHRLTIAWAILRGRHPLLASRVLMHPGDYQNVHFVYSSPDSPQHALQDARDNLQLSHATKEVLLEAYLNGPRTLSDDRISYLILSFQTTPLTPPATPQLPHAAFLVGSHVQEFDLLICAAHFLGDGIALHTFANDLFLLLTGTGNKNGYHDVLSDETLYALLEKEWSDRWAKFDTDLESPLSPSLESRLPPALSTFQRVASAVAVKCSQDRVIGGHSFIRATHGPRHTIVPTVSFDSDTTKYILKKCKSEGVSIAHALFALCNIAWIRIGCGRRELPMMMYSALNLRPYLIPANTSYWFLAVGYFNVVLPSFLPSSTPAQKIFWHRARSAKLQSTAIAKSPMLIPRTRCMAIERGIKARHFARQDDRLVVGDRLPPTPTATPAPDPPSVQTRTTKPPSAALVGLSLLGNLDGIYMHSAYDTRVVLHTLTTGSRQREGAMLLFGYTFAGRLWLSLGYDEHGFDREQVGRWWAGVVGGVEEFLAVEG